MNTRVTALLIILCMLASCASHAQNFKKSTIIELTAIASTITADGFTTTWDKHYEYNPIARPFVSSTGGRTAYFGASFGAVLLTNRLLREHPKIRHVFNWAVVGSETFLSINNKLHSNAVDHCKNVWLTQGRVVSPCHL